MNWKLFVYFMMVLFFCGKRKKIKVKNLKFKWRDVRKKIKKKIVKLVKISFYMNYEDFFFYCRFL